MESGAVLRSLHFTDATGANCHLKMLLEKPRMITISNAHFADLSRLPVCGRRTLSRSRSPSIVVCSVKTSDISVTAKAKNDPDKAISSDKQRGLQQKGSSYPATFPRGFEVEMLAALLTEVCDETKIAELKVKIGTFEIHMKRSIDGPAIPAHVAPQAVAPPVPSKPANDSATTASPPSKISAEKVNPYTNVSSEKEAKLAALEASGSSGFVIVSSPSVGTFRKARTLKGKKQPPACKEGDVVKEGQVIGFIDQFGTEFPIKSDVAGEVIKLLHSDGEAVGYGDPLIAVLPSFHSIRL